MKIRNFKHQLEERLNQTEIADLEEKAKFEEESLKNLQREIATIIAQHMEEAGMGFNDVTRGLGISPAQTAKILKGKANLTCASLAHIAAFLGKRPHLIFD